MVQVLNEPKFPVIREVPEGGEIMQGFRKSDWRNIGLVTVLTAPFGYYAGRPLMMRQTMFGAMGISALFGFVLGWEKAHARIMGFRENAEEVDKFGKMAAAAPAPVSASSATAAASASETAGSAGDKKQC